jgi:hypothetical protein
MRVLVLPADPNETDEHRLSRPSSNKEGWTRIMLLGYPTKEEEHLMTIMQGAQLLKEIGGVPVSQHEMYNAIKRINERTTADLESLVECKIVRGATLTQVMERVGKKPYCEHPLQSLQHCGVLFKALMIPNSTPVISAEDRFELLFCISSFYDLEAAKPARSGSIRDAWNRALERQDQMRARYWDMYQ